MRLIERWSYLFVCLGWSSCLPFEFYGYVQHQIWMHLSLFTAGHQKTVQTMPRLALYVFASSRHVIVLPKVHKYSMDWWPNKMFKIGGKDMKFHAIKYFCSGGQVTFMVVVALPKPYIVEPVIDCSSAETQQQLIHGSPGDEELPHAVFVYYFDLPTHSFPAVNTNYIKLHLQLQHQRFILLICIHSWETSLMNPKENSMKSIEFIEILRICQN